MNALADALETRAASTEVAKQTQEETVLQAIERQRPQIALALPPGYTPDRFTRTVITAVKQTPALQLCTASSLLGAVMLSAQLGLEPGPLGHCYFVPFKNRGVNEVTFIVGYKGLVDLAYRSPRIESIVGRAVREGDTFEYEQGLDEKLVHIPARTGRGTSTDYYVIVRLVGGGHVMWSMSREDVEKVRTRSRAGNNGPWQTDYDPMAIKTVLRAMSPWIPKSTEWARALGNDDIVVNDLDADLADRVIDVEEVDPDGDRPGGGAATSTSKGGDNAGGSESPSTDGPVPSAAAASSVGESGSDANQRVSGERTPDNPAEDKVNDEGAQQIGMRCADAGIGDDTRQAFLYAFSGGAYHRAHDVPVADLGGLFDALAKVKRGQLVLHVPELPGQEPALLPPGVDAPGISESTLPPAPSIMWKKLLGGVKGVAEGKLIRRARQLAEEQGYTATMIVSLDTIPPALDDDLRAWLNEQAAA